MRKVILYVAASLDGYIADRDNKIDWLVNFPNPEKDDFEYTDLLSSIDTVIMGGATYRSIIDMNFSPYPYHDKENYIISRIIKEIEGDNMHLITDNVLDEVKKLKDTNGKDIWLVGGGEIVSLLMNRRLIDEIQLVIVPIVLGDGTPLFPARFNTSHWETTECKQYANGMVGITYMLKSEE